MEKKVDLSKICDRSVMSTLTLERPDDIALGPSKPTSQRHEPKFTMYQIHNLCRPRGLSARSLVQVSTRTALIRHQSW